MAGKRKSPVGGAATSNGKKSKASASSSGAGVTQRRSLRLREAKESDNHRTTASPSSGRLQANGKAADGLSTNAIRKSEGDALSKGRSAQVPLRNGPKATAARKQAGSVHVRSSPISRHSNPDDGGFDISEHSVVLEPVTAEAHEENQRRLSQSFEGARQLVHSSSELGAEDGEQNTDSSQYWLMKAEPESRIEKGVDVKFSIDDLENIEMEGWDGVRNPVARNNMRQMMKGDLAFFYHSNCKKPGVAGVMEVVKEHSVDGMPFLLTPRLFHKTDLTSTESAFDPASPYYDAKSDREKPRWCLVHVAFRHRFDSYVTLKELQKYAKDGGPLKDLQTLKQTRLSVSKVSKKQWDFIAELGGGLGESEEVSLDAIISRGSEELFAVPAASPEPGLPTPKAGSVSKRPQKRKKRKLTTKKQRREAREADHPSFDAYGGVTAASNVRYWKARQLDCDEDEMSANERYFHDYYVEELRKAKAELKDERSWNKNPKPVYQEKEQVVARSAENGFPQPDPYDTDHNCMIWNRPAMMSKPVVRKDPRHSERMDEDKEDEGLDEEEADDQH